MIASFESQSITKLLSNTPKVNDLVLLAGDGVFWNGAKSVEMGVGSMFLCLKLDCPYLPAKMLRRYLPVASILQLISN